MITRPLPDSCGRRYNRVKKSISSMSCFGNYLLQVAIRKSSSAYTCSPPLVIFIVHHENSRIEEDEYTEEMLILWLSRDLY